MKRIVDTYSIDNLVSDMQTYLYGLKSGDGEEELNLKNRMNDICYDNNWYTRREILNGETDKHHRVICTLHDCDTDECLVTYEYKSYNNDYLKLCNQNLTLSEITSILYIYLNSYHDSQTIINDIHSEIIYFINNLKNNCSIDELYDRFKYYKGICAIKHVNIHYYMDEKIFNIYTIQGIGDRSVNHAKTRKYIIINSDEHKILIAKIKIITDILEMLILQRA